MKVLHITNWYPNDWSAHEGVFIKEQFDLFKTKTDAKLVNVQVRKGNKLFKLVHRVYNENEEAYFIFTSIQYWIVIELLTTLLVLLVLLKKKVNRFNLCHVHIAYPILRFYKYWKFLVKVPILVSEHWSAYHFNFNLSENSKSLKKMRAIFSHGLPLTTVSHALQNDIIGFSGKSDFGRYILPNLLDLETFKYSNPVRTKTDPTSFIFFIVNVWRSIKNPYPMLEALSELVVKSKSANIKLLLGGYGDIIPEIEQFVVDQSLQNNVTFLGKMDKNQIAKTLNAVDAYLFTSNYETFSIACAQALCCGVPIIGPRIPSIQEYAGENEAIFLSENSKSAWVQALELFMKKHNSFRPEEISKRMHQRFSKENFIKQYSEILYNVLNVNN